MPRRPPPKNPVHLANPVNPVQSLSPSSSSSSLSSPSPSTLLEDLCLQDPAERRLAEAFLQRVLTRLDDANLPLTDALADLLQCCALAKILTQRALRATLPSGDTRVPAAQFTAATAALKEQHRLQELLDTALEKHQARHAGAPKPAHKMTEAEHAAANDAHWNTLIHDLRIPIGGLALDRQPARLQALAHALRQLDEENKIYQLNNLPTPYQLPTLPDSLRPAPRAPTTAPPAPDPPAPSDKSDKSDKSDSPPP